MQARFNRHMKLCRFKEFRSCLPKTFELPMEKDYNLWWAFSSAIKDFNDVRKENAFSSWMKVMDESMLAQKLRATKNGSLPNVSHIVRKPELLGAEFKSVHCLVTRVMTHLEIQRGKFLIREIEH